MSVAKSTTLETIGSGEWVQIADADQFFMFSVESGAVFFAYSATQPSADAEFHKLMAGDFFADSAPTEKTWLRCAQYSSAAVALTVEEE